MKPLFAALAILTLASCVELQSVSYDPVSGKWAVHAEVVPVEDEK